MPASNAKVVHLPRLRDASSTAWGSRFGPAIRDSDYSTDALQYTTMRFLDAP